MMKIRPKGPNLNQEQLEGVKKVIHDGGAILRALQESNEGYDPLWPEEQYDRKDPPGGQSGPPDV